MATAAPSEPLDPDLQASAWHLAPLGEGLDFCRHHLRNVRRYREHLLSEPEEKILAEKALTGAGAWTRLFEELTSAIEVALPTPGGQAAETANGDGKVALDVALSRLS